MGCSESGHQLGYEPNRQRTEEIAVRIAQRKQSSFENAPKLW